MLTSPIQENMDKIVKQCKDVRDTECIIPRQLVHPFGVYQANRPNTLDMVRNAIEASL